MLEERGQRQEQAMKFVGIKATASAKATGLKSQPQVSMVNGYGRELLCLGSNGVAKGCVGGKVPLYEEPAACKHSSLRPQGEAGQRGRWVHQARVLISVNTPKYRSHRWPKT